MNECPPELRGRTGRESRARRGRQRLTLLEAALPGQGTLLLLILPLLVLLLLFLHLVRKGMDSGEARSRGQWRLCSGSRLSVPTCSPPARPLATYRRGLWPAADRGGAAHRAGLAALPTIPRGGAAVHAAGGAAWRRQRAGGGRARAQRHGCGGMSAVGVWPTREAGPCPAPCGGSPRAAAPTLVPAVAGQCDCTATPCQEGEGGRHETVHDAALPCAQLQAAI